MSGGNNAMAIAIPIECDKCMPNDITTKKACNYKDSQEKLVTSDCSKEAIFKMLRDKMGTDFDILTIANDIKNEISRYQIKYIYKNI